MAPLKCGYLTIRDSDYFNIAEAQETYLITTCMKIIQVLKEEIGKSFKEIQENTNDWRE